MDPQEIEETHNRLVSELKLRLTDEFLETLVMAAEYFSWSCDLVEIQSFVNLCHLLVDKESPVLTPKD